MNVIIAGGGTGGHIFPAVAIGHALQKLEPGTKLLFVGALGKMEMEKVPQEGFEIVGLDIVGFNRSHLWKNLALPFKLWKSRRKARQILNTFKPDVVIGVGGFASYPVLSAAQHKGIPTLIQEQNSFAGKSNKILGRKANAICVAYEGMDRFFPSERITLTGNPVRATIAHNAIGKEEGLDSFGLKKGKKTLLVIGGSLGAKTINEAIAEHLGTILKWDVQVIWQTGRPFYQQALAAAEGKEGIVVREFIRNMEYAYAAADIVVSRAGAIASAELCIVGKPVLFVPYPYAAEDHQTSNAMALVDHSAASIIKDSEARQGLVQKLNVLVHNEKTQQVMSENIRRFAIKDADLQIAKKAIAIATRN